MRTCTSRDGQRLVYHYYDGTTSKRGSDAGDQPRYHVVMHHGAACSSLHLHALAQRLASAHGLCIWVRDVRGHGESITFSGPGIADYLTQLWDDLHDFLNQVVFPKDGNEENVNSVKHVVFVGHSAQGGGAWWLALRPEWRERFAGFVAVAPMIGKEPELMITESCARLMRPHKPRLVALMIWNKLMWWAQPGAWRRRLNRQSVLRFFFEETTDTVNQKYAYEYNLNCIFGHGPMAFEHYVKNLGRIPLSTRILSLSAEQDEVFTDRTPLLRPLFPTGQHVTIPDTNHFVILALPDVACRIADFVRTVIDEKQREDAALTKVAMKTK